MKRINKILALAKDNLNRSVIKINPNILKEEKGKSDGYLTFGVKNTMDIPRNLINRLRDNKKYLWTTIDRMAHLGRSTDTELINPLTYRIMTGSTSGSPINIIKGINDFAIGTDGGGSVLAPALSCNLYSFLGSGLDVTVNKHSESTDGISFSPGIGIIGKDLETLKGIIEELGLIKDFNLNKDEILKVVVPKRDSVLTPDKRDMYTSIVETLEKLKNIAIVEYEFKNIYDRKSSVEDLNYIFNNKLGDLVVSFEGPIDLLGYDETIQRSFKGETEKELTARGGKALVKSANICRCTAITIPTDILAAGFLICAPKGIENAIKALKFAER